MGQSVQAVIDGLPVHAELLGQKWNENRGAAGRQAPLDLHGVEAEGERGHKALFLLEVQPPDCAVVFLRDTRYSEKLIFKLFPGGSHIDNKEGQKKHSLISALQILQQRFGVLAERHKVGR